MSSNFYLWYFVIWLQELELVFGHTPTEGQTYVHEGWNSHLDYINEILFPWFFLEKYTCFDIDTMLHIYNRYEIMLKVNMTLHIKLVDEKFDINWEIWVY